MTIAVSNICIFVLLTLIVWGGAFYTTTLFIAQLLNECTWLLPLNTFVNSNFSLKGLTGRIPSVKEYFNKKIEIGKWKSFNAWTTYAKSLPDFDFSIEIRYVY